MLFLIKIRPPQQRNLFFSKLQKTTTSNFIRTVKFPEKAAVRQSRTKASPNSASTEHDSAETNHKSASQHE